MSHSISSGLMRIAVAAAAALLGAQGAWAACTRYPGATEKFITMDMGKVIISNDLPVGAVIARKVFPIPTRGTSEYMFDCTRGGGTLIGEMLLGAPMPSDPTTYSTAVPGIGIRLSRVIDATLTVNYPHRLPRGPFYIYFPLGTQFQVELIKTAAATGNGALASGTYTRYYGDGDGVSMLTTVLSGNGITIAAPSCSVDLGSRNVSVQFGRVPQSNFKGRGSTTGDRNFNIKLSCQAGQNTQNTVYLRMDATQDPSNEQGVLKITQGGSGTATGVGIQVVDNQGVPVKFGEDTLVGPSKNGDYVLPYTARYYQTGNKVTPGRADGTATFTLDYK
ncbi:fimbrial protein [Variovorax sp. Varisp85]|uniref:fimbrial protein n=1 Tax=unclassified Variovorax TaxID=663243 RepID=UPI000270FA96|nr:fimbrial protein [Variovorax sp. CF313]EJL78258.1 P pilus assembly protein, pilin FimA [Variovorax sp. CF313]